VGRDVAGRFDRVERVDFLAGVRVLELGDGVAGAAATSTLWSLGADVTTVVDPASPHRRSRPSVARGDEQVGLLSLVLDRGKETAALEGRAQLERALPGFDLVVVDRVGRSPEPLAALGDVDHYLEFASAQPGRAWVTISAFGLDGPRRNDVATELTLAAASGTLDAVRAPGTGRPLKLAGWQSLLGTGLTAALAACDALDRAQRGEPAHLDLSALDAAIALGPVLAVDRLLLGTASVGGVYRSGAPAGHYPCRDGAVRVAALEDHQWRGVVDALGVPELAVRFPAAAARVEGAAEIDECVTAWTSSRTKADAEAQLQAHGVPALQLSSPAELLHSPQLLHRHAFDALPIDDGRAACVVGLPFARARATDDTAAVRTRSLRKLRVLELTHVLAAPLAGALLGALGADVTKVEDLARIDMYRRRGPFIDDEPGMERSAYFTIANHSKGNAVFDVAADPDALAEELARTDVVLENLGRRRAELLGVAAASLVNTHPDVLAVSSSGFGHDGPYASYRAYAYSLHTACGLEYLTRTDAGDHAELDLGWADLVTAYALATIIGAWAVGPRGNAGCALDVAMLDLTVARFNEHLAAASLDPGADATFERANALAPYAPHGVFATADGWIALAVDGADEAARVAAVLGVEVSQGGLTDAVIEAATRRCTGAEVATALSAAGVAAEVVLTATDLIHDDLLAARGTFVALEHPVWGPRRIVGLPWRAVGGPPIALGGPPRLPGGATGCA
jgi:crotonobetainyl-CoA:carnitine CoA-transferase CaiB-like acyl-CoA transferase